MCILFMFLSGRICLTHRHTCRLARFVQCKAYPNLVPILLAFGQVCSTTTEGHTKAQKTHPSMTKGLSNKTPFVVGLAQDMQLERSSPLPPPTSIIHLAPFQL
jgi:hypothetical protein